MNSLMAFCARWRRALLFGAWALALAELAATGRYQVFLRPAFGVCVAAGAVFLAVFAAAQRGRPATTRLGWAEGVRLGLLAAPLIYLLGMGNAQLDAAAFHARSASLEAPAAAVKTAKPAPAAAAGAPVPASAEPGAEPEAGPEELTVLELLRNSDSHLGQRVTVAGMVLSDERVLKIIGEKRFLLFRFVITCCAADATPAAVAVEETRPGTGEESQWLSVTGEFDFLEKDGKRVPVLRKAKAKPMEAPEQPYLY